MDGRILVNDWLTIGLLLFSKYLKSQKLAEPSFSATPRLETFNRKIIRLYFNAPEQFQKPSCVNKLTGASEMTV
jgi:hypothetical protein